MIVLQIAGGILLALAVIAVFNSDYYRNGGNPKWYTKQGTPMYTDRPR